MSEKLPSPFEETQEIDFNLPETGTAKEKASPLFPEQSSLPSVIGGRGLGVMSDENVHSPIPKVHTLRGLSKAASSKSKGVITS